MRFLLRRKENIICPYCDKRFASIDDWRTHVVKSHNVVFLPITSADLMTLQDIVAKSTIYCGDRITVPKSILKILNIGRMISLSWRERY